MNKTSFKVLYCLHKDSSDFFASNPLVFLFSFHSKTKGKNDMNLLIPLSQSINTAGRRKNGIIRVGDLSSHGSPNFRWKHICLPRTF
jgi:hypothetical protein